MPAKREVPALLVRADADATRGTGHVMRCLALAQAWHARGGETVFITRCTIAALRNRILALGSDLISLPRAGSIRSDVETTTNQISIHKPALLVIDGYHIDTDQQQSFRAAAQTVLVIDDTAHLDRYDTDILLNQNLGADKLAYSCGQGVSYLLGPKYALLRRDFLHWRRGSRVVPGIAGKLLVTLGGSDPTNFTSQVLDALSQGGAPSLEARIVVGAANPHLRELIKQAASLGPAVRIVTDVSEMAELMAWADLAITATGGTSWELLCMGVPAIGIAVADNQRLLAEELHAHGAMEVLGWHQDVSPRSLAAALGTLQAAYERRLRMSQCGRALVDGRGADRVVDALLAHASAAARHGNGAMADSVRCRCGGSA